MYYPKDFPVVLANAIFNSGFTNKRQVRKAFKAGYFIPNHRPRIYGWVSHIALQKWLGLPLSVIPIPMKHVWVPNKCPKCGSVLKQKADQEGGDFMNNEQIYYERKIWEAEKETEKWKAVSCGMVVLYPFCLFLIIMLIRWVFGKQPHFFFSGTVSLNPGMFIFHWSKNVLGLC